MDRDELRRHLGDLAGHASAETSSDQPAFGQLGKYRIDKTLGTGGQSVALRAWDSDLERHVVLKVYYRAETDELREQVLKEGRALSRVSSPYVAKCHTVETFAGRPCLVLEYVAGHNLGARQGVYLSLIHI